MSLSLDRWVGKIAVVTGASSGIGAAISEFLVDKGLIVVGLARRIELIEERAGQLADRPGKLYGVKVDIRKEEEVICAFEWIARNLGHVHILINNAGVVVSDGLWNGDGDNWKKVMEVNIFGLCIATREAVQVMKENGINGHIIHINSVAGLKVPPIPELNVYAGTKYAVTALAETLKQEFLELGLKIKITNLCPGFVATEMTSLNPNLTEERKELLQKNPMLKPEDIAETIGYILSTPERIQINQLVITPTGEVV